MNKYKNRIKFVYVQDGENAQRQQKLKGNSVETLPLWERGEKSQGKGHYNNDRGKWTLRQELSAERK